ncbi:MAG: cupin domain-containing protein [Anaerolineae bacterium]|nr:cupin domain-containing protein [Anaerolineae bacterium]
MSDYTFIDNLDGLLPEVTPGSVVSRAFLKSDSVNVTLFGFDTGEGLTEHTSSFPAVLHFLEGEADLMLGDDHMQAKAGTWVAMPPRLPHSIVAKSPVKMLLLLILQK